MKASDIVQRIAGMLSRNQSPLLGIDIQRETIRFVAIGQERSDVAVLTSLGKLDVDLRNADPDEQHRIGSYLKQVTGGITRCAFSLEHPTLRIRRMNIAEMPTTDMIEAIRWNFREHIDCPIEQYRVSFKRLERFCESGKVALMAYGVAEEAVQFHFQLAKGLGMKLVSIEPVATTLLASVSQAGHLMESAYVACLLVEEAHSNFVVFSQTDVLFSRPLPGVSFQSLGKLLERNLEVGGERAQQLFDEWVESTAHDDDDLSTRIKNTISHFFSQMAIEMQRSIDAFCIMYDAEGIGEVFVCGKGARFPDVLNRIEHSLGVPMKMFDPFEAFESSVSIEKQSPHDRARYAVACGLALPLID